MACVQAKLDCSNVERNLLTRSFAAERAAWFAALAPGLQALRAPLPLGRSSTHFRMQAVRELGGWDRFNVADDAGLGVRLRRRGYRALLLESFTFEHAHARLGDWHRQRSRWSKGQIQTWLVHMRQPLRLRRELGWRGWAAFQLTIGGSTFAALATPICWLLMGVWLIEWAASLGSVIPPYVLLAAAAILLVCSLMPPHGARAGDGPRAVFQRVQQLSFSPLYWLLISLAAWRGAVQLLRRSADREPSFARSLGGDPGGGAVCVPEVAALSKP